MMDDNALTIEERAAAIGRLLDELYPDPPIPLHHTDPYTLLIAVLLSAQATDVSVNKATPGLFALADTPQQMAQLSVAQIQAQIRTIGLAPRKAQAIHDLSRILLAEHAGQVPASFEALERLPGVGHKTASVVMQQAFSHPAFPVDTHIHRLAQRWGLSSGKNVRATEADLKALYPPEEWGRRHLQIIYYGREHCPARGHDAAACLICSRYGVAG